MRAWLSVLCLLATACFVSPADAARRMALVVGIGDYTSLSNLANPVRDARAVAGLLQSNGFDVHLHTDLTYRQFRHAVTEFQIESFDAEEVVVFYAGHGMTVVQDNQLVNGLAAADASIVCATRQAERTMNMNDIIVSIAHVPKQILLFDSCRDNPIAGCESSALTAAMSGFQPVSIQAARSAVSPAQPSPSRSTNRPMPRGAAGPQPDGPLSARPPAVLVGYSTALGQTAADGPKGSNSPFADALLTALRDNPNVPFRQVLDKVSRELASSIGQRPWVVTDGGQPNVCLAGRDCETDAALRRRKDIATSKRLAAIVREKVDQDDFETAALLALEALPDKSSADPKRRAWPKTAEGHDALQLASETLGRKVRTLEVEPGTDIDKIVVSPQGDLMVLPGPTAKLQEIASGRLVQEFKPPAGQTSQALVFSHDGDRLVVRNGKDAFIWSISEGRVVQTLQPALLWPHSVRFSPDERYLVSVYLGDGWSVDVHDVATGKLVAKDVVVPGQVAFSLDGHTLISLKGETSRGDDPVTAWSLKERRRLPVPKGKLQPGETIHDIAHDTGYIVTQDTADNVQRIRDGATLDVISTFTMAGEDTERRSYIRRLSANGRRGVAWQETGEVQVVDTMTGRRLFAKKIPGQWAMDVIISPDGKHIAAMPSDDFRGDRVLVYEVDTGHLVGTPLGNGLGAQPRFVPGTSLLLIMEPTGEGASELNVWDAGGWARGWQLGVSRPALSNLSYSLDGAFVLSDSLDEGLRLFRSRDGALVKLLRPTTGLIRWKWTWRGQGISHMQYVAVGGLPGAPDASVVKLRPQGLIDAQNGRTVFAMGPLATGNSGSISPDGRLVFDTTETTGSPDGKSDSSRLVKKEYAHLILRDKATGKPVAELRGHEQAISAGVFAPDSSWIATSSYDGTIRLWSTETGEQLDRIEIDGKAIAGLAVRPDGKQLLVDHGLSARLFRINWDTQGLVKTVKARVTRCLRREERAEYGLAQTQPGWCARFETRGAGAE